MNAENIRVAKWHSIFGKDLMIGLEANIPLQIGGENVDFNCDPQLVREEMISLSPKEQPVLRKVCCPAVVNVNDSQTSVRFLPCFIATKKDKDGKDVKIKDNERYFLVGLFQKTGARRIQVSLARFPGEGREERKPFGFENPYNPYQYLDFLSKRKYEFVPLFVKIKNKQDGSINFLVVELGDVTEDFVECLVKRVSPAEVPPILL